MAMGNGQWESGMPEHELEICPVYKSRLLISEESQNEEAEGRAVTTVLGTTADKTCHQRWSWNIQYLSGPGC